MDFCLLDPYVNCASAFHLAGLGLGSADFLGSRGLSSLGDVGLCMVILVKQ